jgi:hypothetical protein
MDAGRAEDVRQPVVFRHAAAENVARPRGGCGLIDDELRYGGRK